jgi:anaerobic ribonucleoside-triphosphate reductase
LVETGVRGSEPPTCEIGRRFADDCPGCAAYSPGLTAQERTRCEVWTRVMGYHRPVSLANPGKQSEHRERVFFRENVVGP